jgi:integrase
MTVKVRKYTRSKRVGVEADIRFRWPDGTWFRRRFRAPVNTEAQALRWGGDLERRIYAQGKDGVLARSKRDAPVPDEPVAMEVTNTHSTETPTLGAFWPRFITGHCEANRHKPSSIERKQSAYRTWLKPKLSGKRLDEIGAGDIAALKGDLAKSSARTANNVLTALSACLKFAGPEGLRRSEGLGLIEHVPRIRLLPLDSDDVPQWYEVHEFKRLVAASARLDARVHAMVLLAGSAGLRKSEIAALKWSDLDLKRRIIHVQRSIWEGKGGTRHETVPKGGKGRKVTMTEALGEALSALRHLRGPRVLYTDGGQEVTDRIVQRWYSQTQRAAGLEVTGGIHRLRHTFCSMLAAEGALPGEIQKLAGHKSITTTMRYMHLSPTRLDAAIGLLDRALRAPEVGETLEKVVRSS